MKIVQSVVKKLIKNSLSLNNQVEKVIIILAKIKINHNQIQKKKERLCVLPVIINFTFNAFNNG
jgi:hypothetical protein